MLVLEDELNKFIRRPACAPTVNPNNPLKWASYASQVQATPGMQESAVLATGARVGSLPVYFMDRRARKAACSSITVKTCVKAQDENMYTAASIMIVTETRTRGKSKTMELTVGAVG